VKFHPSPRRTSAHWKCPTSCPERATATQPISIATPARITLRTPKRWISEPVKKLGANIAITCPAITVAAAEYGCPQNPIASGVAVMRSVITP
jgi:hypothetical protein